MDTLRMLAGYEQVEVYSVDEAFIRLPYLSEKALHDYAESIRRTTEQWTGIPVSIGIAPTKVLSKVANRLAKKNKQATGCIMVLQSRESIERALEQTPVGDIWGVGRRYAYLLEEIYGIHTAKGLSGMQEGWAHKHLGGVVGERLIRELNGEPCIEMKDPLEKKKMIATTRMFGRQVTTLAELREAVASYVSRAAEKLRRQHGAATAIDVFLVAREKQYPPQQNYHPRATHASITLPFATADTRRLISYALPLVKTLFEEGKLYIKAGVLLYDIVPDGAIQGNLFHAHESAADKKLLRVIDNLNFSMREDMVAFASAGTNRSWKMRQEHRSKKYTTQWNELFEIR
jgi:DNA polymerase V